MSEKIDAWNPNQYEKFKEQRSLPFFDLMAMLEPKENARIVDLGCGTGELTEELHHYAKADTTIGIDSSDQMLAKAATFAKRGLQFEKGDIATWDQPQSFDVIFSNAAIQWCNDHPGILARLKKSLRPGGQLAIQMPMNHHYPTHVLARQMSQETKWLTKLNGEPSGKAESMLTVNEYASLLYKLGFAEQKVNLRVYGHVLENREGVIEWVRGTLLTYFQTRMTGPDFTEFTNEFRRRLFLELPDERPFFYPFQRILMWAR